jgi:AraC-like DNA-binding protein
VDIQVEHQVFTDVDEHAEALRGWSQRYQQISSGSFRSALTQLTQGHLTIFREQFSQRITQQGMPPAGPVVTLGAVLNTEPSPPAWFQGQPLGVHEFLCVPGETEFTLHLPPNAKIFGVTLKQSEWERLIPEQMHATFHRVMLRRRISASPRDYLTLCDLINCIINRQLAEAPACASALDPSSEMERIPAFITSIIAAAGPVEHGSNNLTHMVHADIVERCRRIAMCPAEKPVTVADLCRALKISPRTLENSFVAVTGTSPASYLRSVRLAEVRRRLLDSSEAGSLSIGDAAAQWGFSTIHFAATYQKQYGELPSATTRRQGFLATA